MRPRYDGGKSRDIVRWFKQKMESIEAGNEAAIQHATVEGAEIMRDLIKTRGTKREWTSPDKYGRKSSDPGRVASGRMVEAVESSFSRTERGNVVGRFGWLSDREDYFRYQEGGFRHEIADVDVPGMYALVDAFEAVKQTLEDEIRGNLNGA